MNDMTENKDFASELLDPEESARAEENFNHYRNARLRNHDAFVQKATLCDNFVFDNQWEEKERAALAKARRPALTINRIKPALLTMIDDLLKNRTEIKFVPAAGANKEIAAVHTKLLRHVEHVEDLRSKEIDLIMDGMITSRAYYLVRVRFDDNYRGEVSIQVPNPKSIIPDPNSDSYSPEEWNEYYHVSWLSKTDLERLYGKEAAARVELFYSAMQSHELGDQDEDTYAQEHTRYAEAADGTADKDKVKEYLVVERQYRVIESVPHFLNPNTGDLRRIPPHWDSEDIEDYLDRNPQFVLQDEEASVIRWVVSCGQVLLHDDLSPYRSFNVIPFFPLFRRGKSSGGVESLIDPQRNYNKLRSSELHIVSGTSNSGWKVKDGELVNMTVEELESRGSQTGLVIVFREDPKNVERIQPVSIPQGMDRIAQKADSDFREISGLPDEARTLSSPLTSGKRIEAQQRTNITTGTLYLENLNRTRRMLAKKVLEVIQAFYSEQRTINIIGEGVDPKVEVLEVNVAEYDGAIKNDLTEGEFSVVLTSAPARDSHDQSQFELLVQMQKDLGIPIPPHILIEHSSLDRKDEIAAEIKSITGGSVPSEEERQIAQEERMAALEERRAAAEARRAQAMLSAARAKKVIQEIERADTLSDEKYEELLQKARDLDIRERELQSSHDIRRRAQEDNLLKTLLQDEREREKLRLALIEADNNRARERNTTDDKGQANGNQD